MSDKSTIPILDSILLGTPLKKQTPRDTDTLNNLISKSSPRDLDMMRSHIGKQTTSGAYDSKKAAEALRKVQDYSQSSSDTSKLNTSRQTRTPNKYTPEKSSRFTTSEIFGSIKPIQSAAGLSFAKTIQFAVIRTLLFAFRNVEDYSVGRKTNEELRRTVIGNTQNKHEMIEIRLKGRILIAIFKKKSRLNIHSAFYRWKVKADPLLVKDVVDQFALYTRITFTSAFWRMKRVLHARRKFEAQLKRSEKQRRAGRILEALFHKKLIRHYQYAYQAIKHASWRRMLLLKILNSCCFYQKMDLRKFFVAWRFASGDKAVEIRRKKLIKVFSRGRDLLRVAFDKWRARGAFKQLRNETKQGLGGQIMMACLDSMLLKRLRDALAAIKVKYTEYKRVEKVKERFKETDSYALTLLNMIFLNNQGMNKRIAYSLIKDASHTDRYSKTRVMQKLIFRNEYRIRDAIRHWKDICDLENIIKMNKNIRTFFSVLNYSLRNSTHSLLQVQAENKKKAILKNVLYATRNRLQEAFTRWRGNTAVKHITTEYLRFRNSKFLESVLEKLIKKKYRDSLNLMWRLLKEKESGKFKTAARLMMHNVECLQHYFQLWAANSHRLTVQAQCKSLQQLFDLIRDTQLNHALVIFEASKDQKKKQIFLKLLMTQLENLKKNAFYIWAAKVHQGRIHQEMNWRKRLQIADVLTLRLDFMYRNRLKDALGKIMKQSKEKKLMIHAIIAMQRKVFDQKRAAFLTWQSYKNSLRHEKRRKLAFMLRDYSERNLRYAFQSLKDELRRKQYIMRKTINKLETSSTSNIKFYFYKWIKANETLRALERFQRTLRFFEITSESFKALFSTILDSQYMREEKYKIFKKIFLATNVRLTDAIRLWHSKAKALTLFNKFREELKAKLLERMKVLHTNFSTEAMKYYMQKWKEASKEKRLKRRVILRFLQTNFGLKYMAFNHWKTKASKKYMNKIGAVLRIEYSLKNLRRKNLRWGYDPLAEEWYRGINIKVRTIRQLMLISQGGLKRCFRKWAENIKNLKHIETCRATMAFMRSLNETLRNQTTSWLRVDSVVQLKKQKFIRLIIGNMEINLSDAFRIWKAYIRQMQLEKAKILENAKALVAKLNLVDRRWSKNSLKEAYENLKYHTRIQRLKKRMLIGMLKTSFGMLQDSFSRWRNLPKLEDPRKKVALGSCGYQLTKLYEKAIKSGFDAIKKIWHEKNEKKRVCIRHMLYVTQDNQKRLFLKWKAVTILLRNVEMCRRTLSFFEIIRFTFSSQIEAVIEPDRKKAIKMKFMNKLKDEAILMLRVSLHKWREAVWKLKADEKSRSQKYFGGVVRIAKWIEAKKLAFVKEAYDSLVEHKHYMSCVKRFILALYKTRIGQLLNAWQKWKSIPGSNKNVNKASSFALAKVLDLILQRTLRDSFEKIKEEWIQANEIKRGVIRQMIWLTTGRTRHAFDVWARHSKATKSMQYYKAAQKIFDFSARMLEYSIKDLRKGIIMSSSKIEATTKIVRYFIGLNLRPWFQRWHLSSKIHKSGSKVRIPNLTRLFERLRHKVLKETFEMFRTRNLALIIKRFIGIFKKYETLNKKEAIESIKHHYYLHVQKIKMHAVNTIIRYNKLFSHSSLFTFFSIWRQWSKDYNPWFKRSLNLLAKNGRINPQVAFWRLRDSLRIKGAHLDKHRSEITHKLFLILKKKYEQTLARAFWRLESIGTMQNTLLSMSNIQNPDDLRRWRTSAGTARPSSLDTSIDSSGYLVKFEKQKQLILKLLVRNYTLQAQDMQERLKEYFGRWMLMMSKSRYGSLNKKMNENEIVHLARLGTIKILREKMENAILRTKSNAFALILEQADVRLSPKAKKVRWNQ